MPLRSAIGFRIFSSSLCPFAAAHRIDESLHRSVVPRQQLGIAFADMADAEREDEAMQRDGPPRLDRREQVADRCRAEAFAILQLLLRVRASRFSSVKMSSICLSPSPSMSKALRETKCFSRSTACAGQIRAAGAAAHRSSLPVFGS
jgi:hypothetical protein